MYARPPFYLVSAHKNVLHLKSNFVQAPGIHLATLWPSPNYGNYCQNEIRINPLVSTSLFRSENQPVYAICNICFFVALCQSVSDFSFVGKVGLAQALFTKQTRTGGRTSSNSAMVVK